MSMIVTTYGPGGFDPSKPNDNIIEQVEAPDVPEPPTLDETVAQLDETVALLAAGLLGGV